jgi:peptide chain release factor 3
VLLHRLEHEYNVTAELEPLSYRFARWVEGDPERVREVVAGSYGRTVVHDSKGRPLIRFDSEWTLRTTVERETDLPFHDVAP